MLKITHLTIVLFFCLAGNIVLAQSGNIRGIIKDSRSGETIVGANVIIEETTIGASSGVDGSYHISNLQPGKYNLLVTFVSYHK
ncbi:MAG TPA: carboxypeptidase-like regulatory domain-containing protein [Bacteroidales bacterium]|nr:carboxypeptidase-like regulatory domain-containing protein [Bacteroidales bacterium]